MESSEDDAGAATVATRRVSAREKDVGRIEDVNATGSFHQDPSEPRTCCQTPAMSEDNFDGDSVTSPSSQDVNTSTEAILDMIDEIVDGPGAPKRLPLAVENNTDSRFAGGGDRCDTTNEVTPSDTTAPSPNLASATSAKSEENQSVNSSSFNVQSLQRDLIHIQTSPGDILTATNTPEINDSVDLNIIPQSDIVVSQSEINATESQSVICAPVQITQREVCPSVQTSETLMCVAGQISQSEVCMSVQTVHCERSAEILASESKDAQSSKSNVCTTAQTSHSEMCAGMQTSQSEACELKQISQSECAKLELSPAGAETTHSEVSEAIQTSNSEICITAQISHNKEYTEEPTTKYYEESAEVQTSQNDLCTTIQTSQSETSEEVQTSQSESSAVVQALRSEEAQKLKNGACVAEQTSQNDVCTTVQTSESEVYPTEQTLQCEKSAEVQTSHSEKSEGVQISHNEASQGMQTLHSEASEGVEISYCDEISEVQPSHCEASPPGQPCKSDTSVTKQTSQSEASAEVQTSHRGESAEAQISESEVCAAEQTCQNEECPTAQTPHSEESPEAQTSQHEASVKEQTSEREVCSTAQTSYNEVSDSVQASKVEDYMVVQASKNEVLPEVQSSQSEPLVEVKVDSVELPQQSVPVLGSNDFTVSLDIEKNTVSCSEDQSDNPLANIPSSSVIQTDQSVLQAESAICERTLKCVTSSDNRDNVTVESAESTSSDNSISKRSRVPVVENVTRSPVRRPLVRPAPSRPDSTVSSTVDSSNNVCNSDQVRECLVKDVSSSSDAVPCVHGNVKPEDIRNVNEVSICKAETSSSPTKRIKLIRKKVVPQTSHIQPEKRADAQPKPTEHEQCQSTSSETAAAKSSVDVAGTTMEEISNTPQSDTTLNKQGCPILPVQAAIPKILLSNDLPGPAEQKIADPMQDTLSNIPQAIEVHASSPKMDSPNKEDEDTQRKLPPLKINLATTNKLESVDTTINTEKESNDSSCSNVVGEESVSLKQVPKLTIKLSSKHTDEIKSPVPKLTIKPIKPPPEKEHWVEAKAKEQIPHVTKLNIKPITKQPEKINETHRKSSSSEISESEYSENDESTSTSDQASTSDHGSSDVVPKVTIKLGKPGTESEGQFYTEKNIPKLTIKAIQHCEHEEQLSPSKLKLFISQSENIQTDKIPKLTIKTVAKCESQPLSPKLTIKPIKPPEHVVVEEIVVEKVHSQEIPKLKISTETLSTNAIIRNLVHTAPKESDSVSGKSPKMVSKSEHDISSKSKKSVPFENSENIPVVTKINIKPLIKPSDSTDPSEGLDDKVPVVSKLNIKPIVKSKDSEVDYSKVDVPKITKLNIKPLKSPETNSSEEKDCDDLKSDIHENSIPVITKLNIKPIVKPRDEDTLKDNENQSSETGNSSDDNTDIPYVTKINIKPIYKPNDTTESGPSIKKEDNIPIITKLNIKPLVKPEECTAPKSPKKDLLKSSAMSIPTVTKLNIKPVIKPEEIKQKDPSDNVDETSVKNPPLVMKINRKTVESCVNDTEYIIDKKSEQEHCNNINVESIPVVSKLNIKPIVKPPSMEISEKKILSNINCKTSLGKTNQLELTEPKKTERIEPSEVKQNCISQLKIKEDKLSVSKEEKLSDIKETIPESIAEQISYETKATMTDLSSQSSLKHSKRRLENEDIRKESCTVVKVNSQLDNVSNEALKTPERSTRSKNISTRQNCMLLKKLLEKAPEDDISIQTNINKSTTIHTNEAPKSPKNVKIKSDLLKEKNSHEVKHDIAESSQANDITCNIGSLKVRSMQELCKEANENVTTPLEINVSDKSSQQTQDQDSPRIILKINKTEQGASAKIITEDPKNSNQSVPRDNEHNDIQQKKNILNSRKKPHIDTPMPMGKRLRSSRILQSSEKSELLRRNIVNKRPSTTESSPTKNKPEPELSDLETKRLKLGQILSNKSLTITPIVAKAAQNSPPTKPSEIKQSVKHHSIMNNENCAKNGSSKLHNILSNLQAKQLQAMPFNDLNHTENSQSSSPDLKSTTSTDSPEIITETLIIEKSKPEVQIIFNDNSESRDFSIGSEELAQDPLQVDNLKPNDVVHDDDIPKLVDMTPQPKKRGRPRKIPLSEGAKPVVPLPVPALEERPQRSLRLSRDRPVILVKPRGRGRGRGRRLATEPNPSPPPEPVEETSNKILVEQKTEEEIDPTSSRIKLPRMTEALDKMPSVCSTPLSSRRRSSSTDLKIFGDQDLKVMVEPLPKMEDPFLKS